MKFEDFLAQVYVELPDLEGKLHFESARYDASSHRALISLLADDLIGEQRFFTIRKLLSRALPKVRISLRIASPSLAEAFMQAPADYAQVLRAIIVRAHPASISWMPEIRFLSEGKDLVLEFPDDFSLNYFRDRELSRLMQTAVHDVFRIQPPIVLRLRDDVEKRVKRIEADREAEQASLMQQQAAAQAVQEKKPPTPRSRRIKGSAIAEDPVPMAGLTELSGRVTVAGKVLSVDRRDIPGHEMVLLSFVVTDFTGTMACKIFLRYRPRRMRQEGDPVPPTPEEVKMLERQIAQVKVGEGIKLRGTCQIDRFDNRLVIMVQDMAQHELPRRSDDAPRKRIELHAHTQMSAMDGIMSAKDLISRAAEWGHEAIAITDHGVVQAYPEAFATARKKGIRLIPGLEAYMIDSRPVLRGPGDRSIDDTIVVLDFETTGRNARTDRIIEIGAVKLENGQVMDSFSSLVNPERPLPPEIIKITGIEDSMLLDAPVAQDVLPQLLQFIGDAPLAAHNAAFDCAFLRYELERMGVERRFSSIDTLYFAQKLYPELKRYRLASLCKHLGVSLRNAHRAVHDATATAQALAIMLEQAREQGVSLLSDIDLKIRGLTKGQDYHVILLARNRKGLENINRLVSMAHLDYFHYVPKIPREQIQAHREGLLIGSACARGEIYQAILDDAPDERLDELASFYDYLELQPLDNNELLVGRGEVEGRAQLQQMAERILSLGERLGIPVVATGDAHYLDPEDRMLREILIHSRFPEDALHMADQHFRTTQEMLDCFSFLPEDKAHEIVVDNPLKLLQQFEDVSLYPKHPQGLTTFSPVCETANDDVKRMSLERAEALYGHPLPEIVQKRLDKELKAIIGYGYGTLYSIASKLVLKSLEDGYLVGSRGSVGSSLVATMCGITEVNPLPPHYRCQACRKAVFEVPEGYSVGIDLPPRTCEGCGAPMIKDGYDIPFEVFLGFEGDKVPDIDLNFSGEYQSRAHAYVEELFGKGFVFRAGTIGTLKDKTAIGFVLKYMEDRGLQFSEQERWRLAEGLNGVKRTTGQHPGGIVILPKDYEIYQFTAVQHPADDQDKGVVTTHYDFRSMHDILVKLDILGHDDPTMIHQLERLTGVPYEQVPLDDPKSLSLFTSTEALGVTEEEIGCQTGTLGIPEFGTPFVRQMLLTAKPTRMEELIAVSGLSHGTDVWLGNAKDLIESGVATLRQCICTREDIMNSLILKGLDVKMAFDTMESVRKGKGLTPDMERSMREKGVEEWFINSCKKIAYMFPKGHAVAYVTMALRVAWYKINYPLAYYATYFGTRAPGFDAVSMTRPLPYIQAMLEDLNAIDQRELSGQQKNQIVALELVVEMLARGIQFLPPDLYLSDAERFLIEDGNLRVPFSAMVGFGLAAARSLAEAREERFVSIQDLKERAKLSSSCIDLLRESGALKGLSDTNQVDFFSLL